MELFSDTIIVMKVGNYGAEKITHILPRIKALYESEKAVNPDAFYPFGYQGEYTPDSLRMLLERHSSKMSEKSSSIDVVFSPTNRAYDTWREGCKNKTLPHKFDLGPKKGAWRNMDLPVRGSKLFPERYPPYGGESMSYYGLIIEDIQLFTDSTEEMWIDLKPYRRMVEEDINGWELRGRWRQRSAIPCFRVKNPANVPKTEESVIARAKLVYPYAVQLGATPFD